MPWQPAPIIHADAELACATGIKALLVARGITDVYVGNRIPGDRGDRMVIFNRDGGGTDEVFDTPRMRCRVWDATDQKATDLANLVAALMQVLADGDPVISATKESGPYDVPDSSGQVQKYLLFSLRTRGVDL